jgi:hypothetical protein
MRLATFVNGRRRAGQSVVASPSHAGLHPVPLLFWFPLSLAATAAPVPGSEKEGAPSARRCDSVRPPFINDPHVCGQVVQTTAIDPEGDWPPGQESEPTEKDHEQRSAECLGLPRGGAPRRSTTMRPKARLPNVAPHRPTGYTQ